MLTEDSSLHWIKVIAKSRLNKENADRVISPFIRRWERLDMGTIIVQQCQVRVENS